MNIYENFRLIITGPSGSGKSQLTKKVLWQCRDQFDKIYLICPTHKEQILYTKEIHFDKGNKSDQATDQQMEKYVNEIEKNKKAGKRSLLILDDIIYTEITKVNSELTQWITKCRHYNSSIIICSQLYKGLPPVVRVNCSHFAFFRTDNEGEKKKYGEELGEKMLHKLDEYTEEAYHYLWVNNTKNTLDNTKYGDIIDLSSKSDANDLLKKDKEALK